MIDALGLLTHTFLRKRQLALKAAIKGRISESNVFIKQTGLHKSQRANKQKGKEDPSNHKNLAALKPGSRRPTTPKTNRLPSQSPGQRLEGISAKSHQNPPAKTRHTGIRECAFGTKPPPKKIKRFFQDVPHRVTFPAPPSEKPILDTGISAHGVTQ